jgi:hypothetical protein
MTTRKTRQKGGITFGVQPQPSFTFGVPGVVPDYKPNEWTVTRSTKDLNNYLGLNTEKPYDFRDNFSFTDVGGIQVAKSHENKDVYLFRGNPVYCDKLDFQMYNDKPVWLSNFKVAATYATTSGSVIGYKISKQLNLFVISNIDNIRALLKFYKDKDKDNDEDLKVIKFATGVDLTLEEHKSLFHEEFRGTFSWHEHQLSEQSNIRRVGVTSTDTKLLKTIKEYCENKGIHIDGYYADELFTPQKSESMFHEEICLFSPMDRIKEDRTKSKCVFQNNQNSTSWGGNIRYRKSKNICL